jgi:hypothetical protein
MAIAVWICAGCTTPSYSSFQTVVINPNGNVRLYVSNQSFAISPVDIKVFIDGRRVVDGSFEVGSQHTIEEFVLKLSLGRHKIVAESSKGHAKLEQDFEVNDKTWAALAFWYYPKMVGGAGPCPPQFSFDVSKEPMYFM